MAKQRSSVRQRRAPRGEIGGGISRIAEFAERHSTILTVFALVALLVVGVYIRVNPALIYGLELDESDPWAAYWQAEYFLRNGLFNFNGLSDVETFWWPIGRDFLTTDYVAMPWLAAATYGIGALFGLTLKDWLALFPVFAGAAAIIVLFLLVYSITRSKLGGLVAATFFALSPGAISRTTVGFTTKIGVSVPFFGLTYVFLALALKNTGARRVIYGVLTGFMGAVVGYLWGGYHIIAISLALVALLDPFFAKPSAERLKLYALMGIVFMALSSLYPAVGPRYFIRGLGAVVTLSLVIYALEVYVERIPIISRILAEGVTARFQLWLITVLLAAAVIAVYGGLIPVSGRLLAAVGIRNLSPLVESVQEHQPASLTSIFREYGLAMLFVAAGVVVFAARAVKGSLKVYEAVTSATIYLMTLLLFYANLQLAYFTQTASLFATMAAGIAVGDILKKEAWAGEAGVEEKSRRGRERKDPLVILAGIFIVLIVGISGAYYAEQSYITSKYRAPQILTSGLFPLAMTSPTGQSQVFVPLNNAWLNALAWIKNNTRGDALIVSWWDYGYWITVNTGRKTVADGSTVNETQIRALADVLTGDEGEANYVLRNVFHAEPNNTYIVFYEAFEGYVDLNNNITLLFPMPGQMQAPSQGYPGFVVQGLADFPKSIQMLRIAYKIPPFSGSVFYTAYSSVYIDSSGQQWLEFPGFVGQPQENVTRVRNALIYKMAINGIYALPEVGVADANCEAVLERTSTALMGVAASTGPSGGYAIQYILPENPFTSFKPVALSISCPMVNQVGDRLSVFAVIVFIYQWTG